MTMSRPESRSFASPRATSILKIGCCLAGQDCAYKEMLHGIEKVKNAKSNLGTGLNMNGNSFCTRTNCSGVLSAQRDGRKILGAMELLVSSVFLLSLCFEIAGEEDRRPPSSCSFERTNLNSAEAEGLSGCYWQHSCKKNQQRGIRTSRVKCTPQYHWPNGPRSGIERPGRTVKTGKSVQPKASRQGGPIYPIQLGEPRVDLRPQGTAWPGFGIRKSLIWNSRVGKSSSNRTRRGILTKYRFDEVGPHQTLMKKN
jgi:hypothetical protein